MRIRILGYLMVITVLCGFTAMSSHAGFVPEIPEGQCAFAIVKITPQTGDESIPFNFVQTLNGVDSVITLDSNPLVVIEPVFLSLGETLTYTELPKDGWTIQEIRCVNFAGESFLKGVDSVTFTCDDPGEFAFAACAFFNRVSADKIPTLSEWGLIAAAAGLGVVGVFFAMRRRRLQAGA